MDVIKKIVGLQVGDKVRLRKDVGNFALRTMLEYHGWTPRTRLTILKEERGWELDPDNYDSRQRQILKYILVGKGKYPSFRSYPAHWFEPWV